MGKIGKIGNLGNLENLGISIINILKFPKLLKFTISAPPSTPSSKALPYSRTELFEYKYITQKPPCQEGKAKIIEHTRLSD